MFIQCDIGFDPPQADKFCRKVCEDFGVCGGFVIPPQADKFCRKVCYDCGDEYLIFDPPQADKFCRKVCRASVKTHN